MILVSGFNVYPNEVEEAVAMHEGVGDVAAIGVADENSGEVVKIFVVRKDPNLTAERTYRPLPQASDRLQGAETRRVPCRPAAYQRRQDPAPGPQGRGEMTTNNMEKAE